MDLGTGDTRFRPCSIPPSSRESGRIDGKGKRGKGRGEEVVAVAE